MTAALYVVHWPAHSVLKAGYSATQRWRGFESRGGVVLLLAFYDNPMAALEAEGSAHEALRDRLDSAFVSGKEAQPLLGRHGAGWMECYRTGDAPRAVDMLLSIAQVYAPMHCSSMGSTAMPRTNVRTVRTYASAEIDPSLQLGDARGRVRTTP